MLHHDRPLLFGLVALEQQLVGAADLVDAFRQWRQDPERSLAQILASQGRLSRDGVQAIERLLSESSLAQPNAAARPPLDSPTTTWRPVETSVVIAVKDPPPLAHHASPGPNATERFQPLRLHATGGLGQVFEAEDAELKRRVALKEIRPQYADDDSSRRRFIFEAEVTGNLEHPGIVPVYGLGAHEGGRPFYAMRFIEGETLSEAIQKFHASDQPEFSSLDFRQLLGRLVSACNAVAFAHSRGIVHRDLKPQNVMLGPFGETLVVDWGLAKPLAAIHNAGEDEEAKPNRDWPKRDDELATATGEFVGTPAFMSPEQARGEVHGVGPASDVFSLGAMLYVLLTGLLPRRGSALELVPFAPDWHAPSACADQPRAPRALAAVCAKAMAREPADRYASPLDLAAEIDRWLADEPVTAYREPWLDRAFRWVRKHRLPVAMASALVFVTAVALGVGYVLVSQERNIAQTERSNALASATATRQVVEQFLLQIANERWTQIPGFEDVRLEMVNMAADRYRGLLAQQPEDVELLSDAARAFRRCANLYRMVGKFAEARELYDEAERRMRQVVERYPEPLREQQWLELLLDRAILVRRVAGPTEAEPAFREALAMAARLQAQHPEALGIRQDQARVQNDYADLLQQLGRCDEAILLAQASAATFRQIADKSPSNVNAQLMAAFAGNTLGACLRESGQHAPARAEFEKSAVRSQLATKRSPAEPNVRFALATALLGLAQLELDERNSAATAKPLIEDAVDIWETLTIDFPRTASFRRMLAVGLMKKGRVQDALNEADPARDSVHKALELLASLSDESHAAVEYEPHLAAAGLLAGELEVNRGNVAEARLHLEEAQMHFQRSRAVNLTNQRLAAEEQRCLEKLESTAK